MKNLFYTTCFHKSKNLDNFLFSLKFLSNLNNNLDFIIFTTERLKAYIQKMLQYLELDTSVKIQVVQINYLSQTESLKYEIFKLIDTNGYDRVLFMSWDKYLPPVNDISKFIEDFEFKDNEYLSYHFKDIDKTDIYKNLRMVLNLDGCLLFNNSDIVKNTFQRVLDKCKSINDNPDKLLITEVNTFSNQNVLKNIIDNNLLNQEFRKLLNSSTNYVSENKEENVLNKKYSWKHDCVNSNGFIEFLPEGKLNTTWIEGIYKSLGSLRLIEATWNGVTHILKFSDDYKTFVSLRYPNYHLSSGLIIV